MNPLQNFLKNYGVGSKFTGLDPYKKPSSNNPVATQGSAVTNPVSNPTVSSNPSAVGSNTKPPVITPPVNNSPARDQFISGLTADQARTNLTNAGYKLNSSGQLDTGTTATPPPTGTTTPPPTTTTKKNPFQDYLDSFNAKDVIDANTKAQQRLADIQSRNEAQSVFARQQYENTLDKSGGLKSGAEQAAQVGARRNSASAAYGAVEESAAARSALVAQNTYQAYIDAGKSVYEAETAADKAKLEADKFAKETEQQTFANDLATKKFEEEKRQFGQEYALKKQELDQKLQETTSTATGKEAEALNSMNLINTLLQNPNLGSISGAIQGGLGLGTIDPRSNVQLARNQYNQIKGILSLENRSKLKGQGAVSDFEGKTLERAASALGRNLGDEEFVKQLKQVKGAIATSHGLSADVLLIDPVTKQSKIVLSDSAGIAQAINDGLLVEYQ